MNDMLTDEDTSVQVVDGDRLMLQPDCSDAQNFHIVSFNQFKNHLLRRTAVTYHYCPRNAIFDFLLNTLYRSPIRPKLRQ